MRMTKGEMAMVNNGVVGNDGSLTLLHPRLWCIRGTVPILAHHHHRSEGEDQDQLTSTHAEYSNEATFLILFGHGASTA